MTSMAVGRAQADQAVDIMVPLGSLEQHGAHLPLATDLLIAEAVAAGVGAHFSGSLVVAPCLPIGVSDYHLGFPGTATVPTRVVRDYLQSVMTAFLEGGFRHVYVTSGHAGNFAAMDAAWASLPEDLRDRSAIHGDWPNQRKAIHDWARQNLGLEPEIVGSHGGHFETSVMLHVSPDLVDMTAASAGFIGDAAIASDRMMAQGVRAVSSTGVIGDPRSATAQAGGGYMALVVGQVVELIQRHRSVRGVR
jgi:mycofactocin precursor peptide peptidase